MNYTIIDFETAAAKRATACSIGMVKVVGGTIVSSYHKLIKPECFPDFDGMNMMIHGIGPEDVESEPEFNEIWDEIKPWIEGQIVVAHNTAFDISVLIRTLELYQIEIPKFRYLCSYRLSKLAFPKLPYYRLDYLAKHFEIKFKHHDALEDCQATSQLFDLLMATVDMQTVVSSIKESSSFGKRIRSYHRISDIIVEEGLIDKNSLFYNKEVVFTGALISMTRRSAQQMIANIGGVVGKSS